MEKTCKFCINGDLLESYFKITDNLNNVSMKIDRNSKKLIVNLYNDSSIGEAKLKIKYCPICGHKLNPDN